ncbi:uncharacterized protein LOC141853237 [Brevipalpus obovatus]|uniref:uncharacterized protein LOC141853237 n=1 Tax=Brevipalpus obovatus TaxID=246614 RepID=UPI003D9E8FAB
MCNMLAIKYFVVAVMILVNFLHTVMTDYGTVSMMRKANLSEVYRCENHFEVEISGIVTPFCREKPVIVYYQSQTKYYGSVFRRNVCKYDVFKCFDKYTRKVIPSGKKGLRILSTK